METLHTPGPWQAVYDDNGFYFVVPINERGPSPYIVATGGEGEIDARNTILIAACPDLLGACIEVFNCLANAENRPYERETLKRAIERATGETISL